MNWKLTLARALARWLSPHELEEIIGEVLSGVLQRMPLSERAAFLIDLAQTYTGEVLVGLGTKERAELMNALLPLVAQQFPLEELDLLSAFATPPSSEARTDE